MSKLANKAMKKVLIFLFFMTALMSLTSCGTVFHMTPEESYKYGYNTGVWLRGGAESEYIK